MNWELTDIDISAPSLQKLASIGQLIGRIEGLQLSKPIPKLRAKNRARLVRGSTGIEGNSGSVAQVEAIVHGDPVTLPRKEQVEIKNALDAYSALPEFDPFSIDSLLEAHTRLMGNGLMLGAGQFRKGPVEVSISETETRAMPPWETIPSSMDALFRYLDESDDLMLIKSVRFHYEFVNLHPFFDGNGRVARLWQTCLLMKAHPVFEFLDVESMVFEHRNTYYEAIRNTQETGNTGGFILFMFEQIERSLSTLWKSSRVPGRSSSDRLEIARKQFGGARFSRRDYLQFFKTVSTATASRDLAAGVKTGTLMRSGDKRTTVYRFSDEGMNS